MNTRRIERHPLDDDDPNEPPIVSDEVDNSVAYQPLLRTCVRVLIVSFAVVFVAGIVAGNAAPNSPVEAFASVVHRLTLMVILCAFSGILVAYRIPRIQLQSFPPRRVECDSANPIRDQQVRIMHTSRRSPLATETAKLLARLVFVSTLALIAVVGVAFLGFAIAGPMTIAMLIVGAIKPLLAGLLVTMVVFHQGILRAYAIGVMAVLVVGLMHGGAIGIFPAARQFAVFPFVMDLILAPIGGLLCALYYWQAVEQDGWGLAESGTLPGSSARKEDAQP